MSAKRRTFPSPQPDPDTEAFWAAAREGKLMLGYCEACGEMHYYPRSICPHCGAGGTDLVESAGRGEIYSWSVLRRADPPYAIAYVTLEEGPTMMTNIVDCDLDALAIGQKVELVFSPTEDPDGPPVPTFRPAR